MSSVPQARVFRTSSFRLAVVYAGLTGISFLILFSVIFWSTTRFMRHQIDDSVTSEVDEILAEPHVNDDEVLRSLVQSLTKHSSGFYYLLQDSRGAVRAGNFPPLDPVEGVREWRGPAKSANKNFSAVRGRGIRFNGNYLFVGWSTHQLLEMEEMVAKSFLWGLAASITLALAGGAVMSGRLLRKIAMVSETSRNIIEGDLNQRVPVTNTSDEFDHLSTSINAMLDRIQALMEDLRQVTTDIAHDLRTPLTRLRQRLELAQRSDIGVDDLRAMLGATIEEIDVILGIFAALLRIAQIESGARRAGFTQTSLSQLLATAVELYRPAAEEKNQVLSEAIDCNLVINGDRELLMQLFANLIENAVQHSPRGAALKVAARYESGRIVAEVSDNGAGIPGDMRGKVVQRFFRLENSRTTAGNGLGLSLVQAVAKLHGAVMTFSDNTPGLRACITFVLEKPVQLQ